MRSCELSGAYTQMIIIREIIAAKLQVKHGVCRREVEQCFDNREKSVLREEREEHLTNPPTYWFIAKTNKDRELKVVYVQKGNQIFIKTCYTPNEDELAIYRDKAI